MSHTINPVTTPGASAKFVTVTIVNYATGGEAFAGSEFDATTILGVVLGTVPSNQNSLATPLFPILSAGKVMLFRFTAGAPVEIAPTTALNAVFSAVINAA